MITELIDRREARQAGKQRRRALEDKTVGGGAEGDQRCRTAIGESP